MTETQLVTCTSTIPISTAASRYKRVDLWNAGLPRWRPRVACACMGSGDLDVEEGIRAGKRRFDRRAVRGIAAVAGVAHRLHNLRGRLELLDLGTEGSGRALALRLDPIGAGA